MSRRSEIRTAIVTGASSGIGQELVRQLVRHPDLRELRVIAVARRGDRLEALAAEFPTGKVLPYVADLTSETDRFALIRWAQDRFGNLDLLINNAGLGNYAAFEKTDKQVVRTILALDVEAVVDLSAQAVEWMKPVGNGQIVQISSILGEVGLPYSSIYVAAKHAVNGLVKSVRYELAGTGVSMWAACPGQTVSEFRVVAGSREGKAKGKTAEPTEKVVAGIVRAIVRGQSRALYYPTWNPWIMAHVAWVSPRLWDVIMRRYRRTIEIEDLGDSMRVEPVKRG